MQIGDYQVTEYIDQGNFGKVYKAIKNNDKNNPIAIKIINKKKY